MLSPFDMEHSEMQPRYVRRTESLDSEQPRAPAIPKEYIVSRPTLPPPPPLPSSYSRMMMTSPGTSRTTSASGRPQITRQAGLRGLESIMGRRALLVGAAATATAPTSHSPGATVTSSSSSTTSNHSVSSSNALKSKLRTRSRRAVLSRSDRMITVGLVRQCGVARNLGDAVDSVVVSAAPPTKPRRSSSPQQREIANAAFAANGIPHAPPTSVKTTQTGRKTPLREQRMVPSQIVLQDQHQQHLLFCKTTMTTTTTSNNNNKNKSSSANNKNKALIKKSPFYYPPFYGAANQMGPSASQRTPLTEAMTVESYGMPQWIAIASSWTCGSHDDDVSDLCLDDESYLQEMEEWHYDDDYNNNNCCWDDHDDEHNYRDKAPKQCQRHPKSQSYHHRDHSPRVVVRSTYH